MLRETDARKHCRRAESHRKANRDGIFDRFLQRARKKQRGEEKACMERAGMVLKEFPKYEDIQETVSQGEYSFHVKKYDNEKTVYVYRTEAANMPGFNKENIAPIHICPTENGKYRTLIDDPITKKRIDVTEEE